MSLFPDTIKTVLAGGIVQCTELVRFDFVSETIRMWRGYGTLNTIDGNQWQGIGKLGALDGIEQAVNGEAPQATFTLTGIDAQITRLARDEFEAEVLSRQVQVLIQFFGVDDDQDPGNQRALDNPYPLWSGRCLSPTFTLTPDGNRSIAIDAESLFSLRSRPQWAMYTDSDQQRRFPGDAGFEFVASLVNKVVTWPDY